MLAMVVREWLKLGCYVQECQTRAGMSLLLLELALDRMPLPPLLLMTGVQPQLQVLQVSRYCVALCGSARRSNRLHALPSKGSRSIGRSDQKHWAF